MIQGIDCWEKLDASHSKGLEGKSTDFMFLLLQTRNSIPMVNDKDG